MPNFREGSFMGFLATTDLSASGSYGKIVKLDAAGQLVLAAAATDALLGVLVDTPAAGQTGTVRLRNAAGTTFVRLGGTVTAGAAITANASGLGIATTTTGDQILGYALAAGASGDVAEILPSTGKY